MISAIMTLYVKRPGLIECLILSLVFTVPPVSASGQEDSVVRPMLHFMNDGIEMPNSPVLIKSLGDAAESVLRWTPAESRDEWEKRRPVVDLALRRSLGLDPLPPRTPLNPQIVGRRIFDGYVIENVTFESRPEFWVTANLYRPTNRPGPSPAVLCPIGHWLTPGKTAEEVQRRCIQLVRQGFVVLTYDPIGQGERMVPGNLHHEAHYALVPIGETIAGWMVWDSMRAIDYLQSLPQVDAQRIGITGNSGGGLNSLLTAALDCRVQAAVVVGFTFEFNHLIKYGGTHCACVHWPGIYQAAEWFEIASLIAPRPLLLLQGELDQIFPISGARRAFQHTQVAYRLLGVPQQVRLAELAQQPHAYAQPFREAMYGWMQLHLQRIGSGDPLAETEACVVPPTDPSLLCDPDRRQFGQSPTVVELARTKAKLALDALPATIDSARRESLIAWVHNLVAPPPFHPHTLRAKTHRTRTVPQGRCEIISFHSEDGVVIPGCLYLPTSANEPKNESRPKKVILIVHEKGKQAVIDQPWLTPWLAADYAICAIDVRGRGETLDEYRPGWNINFRLVANQVLMGQPLAGRRAFDIRRAVDYLETRTELTVDDLTVWGVGDEALSVLLAATVDPRISRIALSQFAHSLIGYLRPAQVYAPSEMGDHWNDAQLRGQIGTHPNVTDFGLWLPQMFLHADVPDLMGVNGDRRILWCECEDAAWPDRTHWIERFSILTQHSRGQSLDYAPADSMSAERMLQWLAHPAVHAASNAGRSLELMPIPSNAP